MRGIVKLVITIDTEEDNWAHYCRTDNTLENIERIPFLQDVFNEYGVRPTYLITYPVATIERSVKLFDSILKEGRCEIGAHCHPWNTPPFEEEINEKTSMLFNLPETLIYKKIENLTSVITANFGRRPTSFRAGRWGYGPNVARALCKLGYSVDSSVTPFVDWSICQGPDFSDDSPWPRRCSEDGSTSQSGDGPLLEIPTTIGFHQNNFAFSNAVLKRLWRNPWHSLKIIGLLDRCHLLNYVWLCPEMSTGKKMIKLAQRLQKKNCPLINLFFHSTTLMAGLNNFVKTEQDERSFVQRIREFLDFARDAGIESTTLSNTGSSIPA
jgi:hypothetical protein